MNKSNLEYSEIPYDDFYPSIKYRASTSRMRLLNSNNLIILILFAFINQTTSLNSTVNRLDAYFDTNSQIYHLAQDQYKSIINHNFEKLKDTSYYCFKEGTNWNQSLIEGKCVCKSNFQLLDCGLNNELVKSQLLKKQSNCHFKQDIVNIKRMNKPSRMIFAMPLYECAKRKCDKLIDELVKQYEYIVDLFVFIEIRNSKQNGNEKDSTQKSALAYNHFNRTEDRIRLYTFDDMMRSADSSIDQQQQPQIQLTKELNKVAKVDALVSEQKKRENAQTTNQPIDQTLNQTTQFKNVLYQIKSIDLEKSESKEIVAKVYENLWRLVFKNVANYRSNDKIIFVPPFNRINDQFLNFFKFYRGYGEPVSIVDNFYTRTYSRILPRGIQEDLNEMSSAVMVSFQYAMSVCKFKFENFSQNYCLNNRTLIGKSVV